MSLGKSTNKLGGGRQLPTSLQLSNANRRWTRYPSSGEFLDIVAGNVEFEAVVVDESIGGLGVECDDLVPIYKGQVVTVILHSAEMKGEIADIKELSDGCRISLRWEQKETTIERYFIVLDTVAVVCHQVEETESGTEQKEPALDGRKRKRTKSEIEEGGREVEKDPNRLVSVTLWDGMEFALPANNLTITSCEERFAQLRKLGGDLATLAQVYGLDTTGSTQALLNRVLHFEYFTKVSTGS